MFNLETKVERGIKYVTYHGCTCILWTSMQILSVLFATGIYNR